MEQIRRYKLMLALVEKHLGRLQVELWSWTKEAAYLEVARATFAEITPQLHAGCLDEGGEPCERCADAVAVLEEAGDLALQAGEALCGKAARRDVAGPD